jgi:BsuBI/PstI restriction endonuclease C-terminus.
MIKNRTAEKIFVTAFLDFKIYKRFSETLELLIKIWVAEITEHLIYLNGNKFLGS